MKVNEVEIEDILRDVCIVKESAYNGTYNKASSFLLPMIKYDLRMKCMKLYLKNAFLDDMNYDHDHQGQILFVLMKVRRYEELEWKTFIKNIDKDLYLDDYYVGMEGDHHLHMYVFKIHGAHYVDYLLFRNGKYSQMSADYKKIFPKELTLLNGKSFMSKMWGAFHKTEEMKEYIAREFMLDRSFVDEMPELWDSPKDEEEIYNFKPKVHEYPLSAE